MAHHICCSPSQICLIIRKFQTVESSARIYLLTAHVPIVGNRLVTIIQLFIARRFLWRRYDFSIRSNHGLGWYSIWTVWFMDTFLFRKPVKLKLDFNDFLARNVLHDTNYLDRIWLYLESDLLVNYDSQSAENINLYQLIIFEYLGTYNGIGLTSSEQHPTRTLFRITGRALLS